MSKTQISIHFTSTNDINNPTSKKTKSQVKEDSNNSRRNIKKNILFEENKEEIKSKSCYKTPYVSKNNDMSYSKMEMPVSYQLTNGKCIRLKNSQRSKSYYDSENENNNITLIMESKSYNKSQIDCNIMINKNEKDYSLSKGNNSLISYGKSNNIYPMKFVKHHQKKLMKEDSQKIRQNVNNEIKTYKKFNLMINPSYKYNKRYISSPIHKYLPYCKKNDEKYKKNLISYIRSEAPGLNGGAKSVSCIFANYIKNKSNEKNLEDELYFYLFKKKKKIYSTKKTFIAEKNLYNYYLINGKNRVDYEHPIKFRFYFDNDIGFNYSWQSPLIVANGDDDIETDDEVLNMAEEKCIDDLVEGINTWNKSSRLCRNYILAKKLNRTVKTPTFNHIIKHKGNQFNEIDKENNNKKENHKNNEDNNFIDIDNVSFGK